MKMYDGYWNWYSDWKHYDFIHVFNVSIELFSGWIIEKSKSFVPRFKQRNTWVELSWHDP